MSGDAARHEERPPAAEGRCTTLRLEESVVLYETGNHEAWLQSDAPCEIRR